MQGKEPQYQTEATSFYTTFYNLNWDENGKIPVEEVADRVNGSVEKFGVNEESSVEKFGVNADKLGNTSKTPKKINKTAQKIIDFVISDPSMSAISKLRSMGILSREGADHGGYWRIVINPQTEQ